VALCALAGAAHADGEVDAETQKKADIFFAKGQQDYQQNKFQAAIELFKDAYELVHDPVYLFNVAQSYRKAADCISASDYYNRYLAASPGASNTDTVKQWLRELAPCVDQQKKREQEAAKRAEAQAKAERDARENPSSAQTPTIERDGGSTLRLAGLAAGGLGVIGIGLGVVETVRGKSLQSGLSAACQPSCTYDQIKSIDDQGHRANTIAAIGYIGGGVALAAGVTLYVIGMSKVEHVAITPVPGGATAGATFSW